MKRWLFTGIILIFIAMCVFAMSYAYSNDSNQSKEYKKGYQKGYNDAILNFTEGLAKRDSIDNLRKKQFIEQMVRLGIEIQKYKQATKDMREL